MGSNQFQREYIEYLQKLNTELLDRLNQMKENYEYKILSNDWNRNHLISILEQVLNIFTVVPQEIDIFFDKISAAMGAFKNILLRKSEMLQVMEKINKALNSVSPDQVGVENSDFVKIPFSESGEDKKVGTVKVSPMINGHIIVTEPRIHLSRVPRVFTSSEGSETHQLSPIIEASPDTSSDPSNLGLIFKEVRIPLERINAKKKCYNYISEESPKSRFKGPKTWKKSLSSRKLQDYQGNTVSLENSENANKKLSPENRELPQLENVDPQEGPSWLYQGNAEINSSSSHFIDYKRRKNRFATVFANDENSLSCFEEKHEKSIKGSPTELHKSVSLITENEEEEFEEIKNRIRESSDDVIFESFSSEREENYSPLKKRLRKTKSRSSDKNDTVKFSGDFEKRTSTPSTEDKGKKSISHSPAYLDSSDEDNNMRNPLAIPSKDGESFKKSPVKLLCEKMSAETSFGKTASRTERGEPERQISKRSKNSKKRPAESDALENEISTELENCMVDGKYSPGPIKPESVIKQKKFRKNLSKSESRSQVVSFQENAGRVKRKAAPTFKLVEPLLNTKLRRN